MLDDSKKNEFVSSFPAKRKSTICNKILEPIRAGKGDILDIAKMVFDKFNRFPVDNADIISVIKANTFLFMDAIAYYIEYEKMSHKDKQTLKQANSKQYTDQYMSTQPITEKQIWKLRELGYTGSFDITRLEASNNIEEWS